MTPDQEAVRKNRAQCSWPHLYYGVIPHFAGMIGAKTIAEIGVAYGYHAESILSTLPTARYFGVDPYLAGYDPKDIFVADVMKIFSETDAQCAMDRLHATVAKNLQDYSDRSKLLRLPSVEAAKTFSDGFFDLIFIDGDHTHAAVKADLEAWWPKLREGAIFCGDDYVWPDVKRAVDMFAETVSLKLGVTMKQNTNYPIWYLLKSAPK